MSRGRFVDHLWIHRRMHAKDARMARELQRRAGLQPELFPCVDVAIVPVSITIDSPVVDVTLVPKTDRRKS